MDVFKQNWTQRIHTDPYVNFLLNTEDKYETHKDRVIYYKEYDKDDNIPITATKVDGRYFRRVWRKYTDRVYKERKEYIKTLPEHLRYLEVKWSDPVLLDRELNENTRPQSLYNLRYASLR